jgi:ATP-dependent helicase HepA
MDLLLGGETGNCAFAVLPATGESTLLLELIFVLEAMAPPRLQVDRFLPGTPIRLVIDHKLKEAGEIYPSAEMERKLQKGSPYKLIENPEIFRRALPEMLREALRLAEARAEGVRTAALEAMNHLLGHEVQRLKTLGRVNDHVRPQEIQLAEGQQEGLARAIRQSRIRLDALRLIWKGTME